MKFVLFAFSLICLGFAQIVEANVHGRQLYMYHGKEGFFEFYKHGAKWDSEKSGLIFTVKNAKTDEEDEFPYGFIESPNIKTDFPFNELVVSWNSETPPGSYLTIYAQVRSNGLWSRRFTLGIWNTDNRPVHRMSLRNQRDDIAIVLSDIIRLRKRGDAFRLSAKLSTVDGETYPTLKLLTAHVIDTDKTPNLRPNKSVWGSELDVPGRSQHTVPGGNRFCSATSTQMLLNYWGEKLDRPELANLQLQEAVDGIYDLGWNGTGNWPFNTAYAAEFGGLKAYIARLSGIAEIEDWIAKGVPVITSIDYNVLRRRDTTARSGHLVVVIGFTEEGDMVINDPNTNLTRGDEVRRIYPRKDFEDSWLRDRLSRGTCYLIYPKGWDIPKSR